MPPRENKETLFWRRGGGNYLDNSGIFYKTKFFWDEVNVGERERERVRKAIVSVAKPKNPIFANRYFSRQLIFLLWWTKTLFFWKKAFFFFWGKIFFSKKIRKKIHNFFVENVLKFWKKKKNFSKIFFQKHWKRWHSKLLNIFFSKKNKVLVYRSKNYFFSVCKKLSVRSTVSFFFFE